MATTLTETNFNRLVLQATGLVLVTFRADWCSSCKMLDPVIEALAEQYKGKAIIGKMNVDTDPAIAKRHGLVHIPAILFFNNGKLIDQHTGAIPQQLLAEKINQLLN